MKDYIRIENKVYFLPSSLSKLCSSSLQLTRCKIVSISTRILFMVVFFFASFYFYHQLLNWQFYNHKQIVVMVNHKHNAQPQSAITWHTLIVEDKISFKHESRGVTQRSSRSRRPVHRGCRLRPGGPKLDRHIEAAKTCGSFAARLCPFSLPPSYWITVK